MYYVAYEEKQTKQKRWKVFTNKNDVFGYFKKVEPKSVPDSNDVLELDKVLGNKWSIAKLTAPTRKKLEAYFEKSASKLEGKGKYLPDLINTL